MNSIKPRLLFVPIKLPGIWVGNLETLVHQFSTKFEERQILSLLNEIALGLEYLHENGIVHRDLKPANILVHTNPVNQQVRLIISDFGASEIMGMIAGRRRSGATGTIEFTAPELLVQNEEGDFLHNYDTNSDIWSLGVLLYYLSYACLPFRSDREQESLLRKEIITFQKVRFPEHPKRSAELKELVSWLMEPSPKHRPHIHDVVQRLRFFNWSELNRETPKTEIRRLEAVSRKRDFESKDANSEIERATSRLLILPPGGMESQPAYLTLLYKIQEQVSFLWDTYFLPVNTLSMERLLILSKILIVVVANSPSLPDAQFFYPFLLFLWFPFSSPILLASNLVVQFMLSSWMLWISSTMMPDFPSSSEGIWLLLVLNSILYLLDWLLHANISLV